jgi:hypothetical protein
MKEADRRDRAGTGDADGNDARGQSGGLLRLLGERCLPTGNDANQHYRKATQDVHGNFSCMGISAWWSAHLR